MKRGIMFSDGGTFPANSGNPKGARGAKGKEIDANLTQFNPVIRGPVVPPQGAGNLNTATNTKSVDSDGDLN